MICFVQSTVLLTFYGLVHHLLKVTTELLFFIYLFILFYFIFVLFLFCFCFESAVCLHLVSCLFTFVLAILYLSIELYINNFAHHILSCYMMSPTLMSSGDFFHCSVLVHFWFTFGSLLVHFGFTFGSLLVHLWFTFVSLLIHFCSLKSEIIQTFYIKFFLTVSACLSLNTRNWLLGLSASWHPFGAEGVW